MQMRAFVFSLIACLLIVSSTMMSLAQQPGQLSKNALAVKQKVENLTPHSHITVVPFRSSEEFGEFISHDQEGFTFYDIDEKQNVTLKYMEVKKIKNGYGGYNSVRGEHTDRSRVLIVVLVTVGVLGSVIGAATAAQ